ncbi:MAG: glycosyltransferase family 2 protein, partial [Pseudomonadota bacterium]
MSDPRWGIVATVKAPAEDLLRFAAYHLDLGAHRVYLFLDEANPPAQAHLKAHPKVRFQVCDDTYWRKVGQKRPRKHQVRQAVNATRCYARAELDWIAHIDVDEFLWAPRPVETVLSGLPQSVQCARVRPLESLDGDGTAFKACPVDPAQRDLAARAIYPTFGKLVKGGFLSHVQGKLFVRTGQDGLTLRIHNVYLNGAENPGQVELDEIDLCHVHARDWESWLA